MKNNKYNLIKGEFSAKEAQEILMQLYTNKIKFHQRDVFAKEERNDGNSTLSKNRIEELILEKEKIKDFLSNQEIADKKIMINADIQIDIN